MNRLLGILFVYSAIVNTALATEANSSSIPSQLNLGFYEKNDPNIPSAVSDQLKYIYKIDTNYYSEIGEEKYDIFLADNSISNTVKADILKCKKANLPICKFTFAKIQGTSFLDFDGVHIWTNCHIIKEWIGYEIQNLALLQSPIDQNIKRIRNINIPFTLKNHAGNIIFSSTEINNKDRAVLASAKFTHRFDPQNLSCSTEDDLVKIQLSRPLANSGIKRASHLSIPNKEKLFVGGFPMLTTNRSLFQKNESNGKDFYWTFGSYLPKGTASDEYFGGYPYNLALGGPYTQAILSDGIEGMSGGPVFNENGELVGVFKGLLPLSPKEKNLPIASIFLSLEGMRFVEIFSSDL